MTGQSLEIGGPITVSVTMILPSHEELEGMDPPFSKFGYRVICDRPGPLEEFVGGVMREINESQACSHNFAIPSDYDAINVETLVQNVGQDPVEVASVTYSSQGHPNDLHLDFRGFADLHATFATLVPDLDLDLVQNAN